MGAGAPSPRTFAAAESPGQPSRHSLHSSASGRVTADSSHFTGFSTQGWRRGSTRGLTRRAGLNRHARVMSEPQVVTVRGLRKSYGTRMVVDGLDLDVPAGEIVGLLGANGAGKTTTVECIQGLRKPDGGRLRVLGLDPVTQAEQLRPLVGSQLQSSALRDRLRVGEALDLFSTPRARDGGELLEQFGLTQRR